MSLLSMSANANDVTISHVPWKDLPFADAIKIKKGNGLRKIAVISDPRCKGCRMFSHELEQLDNLTIYIFPVSYFDGSDKLIENVWCGSTSAQTLEKVFEVIHKK